MRKKQQTVSISMETARRIFLIFTYSESEDSTLAYCITQTDGHVFKVRIDQTTIYGNHQIINKCRFLHEQLDGFFCTPHILNQESQL